MAPPPVSVAARSLRLPQYAVRAKQIKTNPKANYDIEPERDDEDSKPAKKGPEFHYLPRYVRVANEHGHASTDRLKAVKGVGQPHSARV